MQEPIRPCLCLPAELLDVYRAAILQLQQHLLRRAVLTLGMLQHALLEFQVCVTGRQAVCTDSTCEVCSVSITDGLVAKGNKCS